MTFPYDSRADLCTMELRVEGKCAKGKHSEFTPIAAIPVAQGISIHPRSWLTTLPAWPSCRTTSNA
ncbi:MAG: hypothetical protein ACLR8Y_07920 [Alistipes indistinctus]